MIKQVVFRLLLLLFPLLVSAADNEKPDFFGAGFSFRQSEYKGKDSESGVYPFVFFSKGNFFIKGLKTGVTLVKGRPIEADIFIEPGFMGYEDGDSVYLTGMDDRRASWDAGIELSAPLSLLGNALTGLSITTDLSGHHQGRKIGLSLSKQFNLSPLFISPGLFVQWQSRQVVNYYYGVRERERIPGRKDYYPGHTVNICPELEIYMALSREWFVFSRNRLVVFGKEIENSPIVGRKHVFNAVLGLARSF